MATQPVLCKGATSSNEVLPLAVDSDGKLELSAGSGLSSNITQWGSQATTLGQKLKASSVPVTLASDEDDINIAATQLPASVGSKASTASLSVTLASDEPAVETSSQAASSTASLTISGSSFDTSVSKDTAGYSKIGIIVESDQTDTTVQLEWSHDNSNWYALEAAQATSAIAGIASGSQNTLYFNASPVAKYVRVHVGAVTAASVVVLTNLH